MRQQEGGSHRQAWTRRAVNLQKIYTCAVTTIKRSWANGRSKNGAADGTAFSEYRAGCLSVEEKRM
jgi:hypothetical protein